MPHGEIIGVKLSGNMFRQKNYSADWLLVADKSVDNKREKLIKTELYEGLFLGSRGFEWRRYGETL